MSSRPTPPEPAAATNRSPVRRLLIAALVALVICIAAIALIVGGDPATGVAVVAGR